MTYVSEYPPYSHADKISHGVPIGTWSNPPKTGAEDNDNSLKILKKGKDKSLFVTLPGLCRDHSGRVVALAYKHKEKDGRDSM